MGLRQLEDLDVSDNLLSALPADITRALKSLRVLDVSRNQLDGFPEPWACPLVSGGDARASNARAGDGGRRSRLTSLSMGVFRTAAGRRPIR